MTTPAGDTPTRKRSHGVPLPARTDRPSLVLFKDSGQGQGFGVMPFQEKSAIAMSATLVAVYGVYFGIVGWWLTSTPVSRITYQPMLIVAVVPLALVAALGHIGMARNRGDDARSERDRIIGLRGERVGGYVLAAGVFGGLIVAMAEVPQFYIAHALLLAWVIAEITSNATKVVLYRRGLA